MQCQSCKKQIANDHTECPFCGTAVTSMPGAAGSAPTQAPLAADPVAPVPAPAPAATTVLTPDHSNAKLPASRLKRFCNYLVDAIVLYVIGFFIGATVNPSNRVGLSVLLGFATSFVFYTVFETALGRTPGKFATGTRVVMKDGSKPTFGAVLIRSLSRIVPFEPLSLLTRSNPAGWHDRWAGTYVVPNSYTPADVQAIDMSQSKKSNLFVILIICFVILIPVIGILSAVVLTGLNTARAKGADARRVADVKQLQLSLELYFDEKGEYPNALTDLRPSDMPSYSDGTPGMPVDPTSKQPYLYVRCTPESYHIAAVLTERGAVLDSDADAGPMCAYDTIDGSDDAGCVAGAQGYCYDETMTPLSDSGA